MPGALATAIVTLAIPLQPFFYIYAIYKRSMGNLEFRVSRILASYSYLIIFATGFVIIYLIAGQILGYDNSLLTFSLLISAFALAIAYSLQNRYLRTARKLAYGTSHDPEQVVTFFANEISQALNWKSLGKLLTKDMLPTLLVRQSALLVVSGREVKTLYATLLEDGQIPDQPSSVENLLNDAAAYRPPALTKSDRFDWVRLAIPVKIGEDALGAWLLGMRNPDDYYPQPDVQLLTTLAGQIGVALDNTRLIEDLRNRADELQIAYNELQGLDKLKEEFIQNISHELRTPLTLIHGYVELMRDGLLGDVNQEQTEALDIVFDRTAFTIRMVNDIISMQQALVERAEMELVDVTTIARKSLRMVEISANKPVAEGRANRAKRFDFELKLSGQIPTIMGMKTRLGQVFDNLLGNAVKFSPDGGEISIEITPCYHRYGIGEKDLVPLPAVEISIRDEGVGIPADKIDHIWERFYQVDGSSTRKFGGMGLGLSIVKEILAAHEGFIWVESKAGNGTTFRFVLPTAETFGRLRSSQRSS